MRERVHTYSYMYMYNMSATHDVHVRDLTSVCSRTSRMTRVLQKLMRVETFVRERQRKKIDA